MVSVGRVPFDFDLCDLDNFDCPQAGLSPFVGALAGVRDGFDGTMICLETLPSGLPIGSNSLAGAGKIVRRSDADAARFEALGLVGFEDNDGDSVLCMGETSEAGCDGRTEYDSCPSSWEVDHGRSGSAPLAGSEASLDVELTFMPCSIDLDGGPVRSVELLVSSTDDVGQRVAVDASVGGGTTILLSDLMRGAADALDGRAVRTELRSRSDPPAGFAVLAREVRGDGDGEARIGSFIPVFPGGEASGGVIYLRGVLP